MADVGPVLLILGSGPNATQAREWPKAQFDQIIVINNAWQVRPDWDALVFPEDFPTKNMPTSVHSKQSLIQAEEFVPAQNVYGGFVHAGATMAFTTAYWALAALKPRVMAFMGCDMVYPVSGNTHFYGTGAADPLRKDVTLRDLGAKSARLAMVAAAQGCACINLSTDMSELVFERGASDDLRDSVVAFGLNQQRYDDLRAQEDALGYATPDGRYDVAGSNFDLNRLDAINAGWLALFETHIRSKA